MKALYKILLAATLVLIPLVPAHAQICPGGFCLPGPDFCPPGFTFVPPDQCVPNPTPSPEPNPVVIAPGMLISLNIHRTLLNNETGGTWVFAPGTFEIYRGLIERLQDAGLDVTVAHYDWRKPVSETSLTYLKPTIDEVKSRTGAGHVDIVAHSMGGLVARDYIQGSQYDNDVDQLITIGTPHRGSADAYLAHEGGDTPPRWHVSAKAYIEAVENALRVANGSFPLPRRPESFRVFFPSLHDLLPTNPYVQQGGSELALNNMATQNIYLATRNSSLDQDLVDTGVELTTIAGTGLNTLANVAVDEPSDRSFLDNFLNRWRDGAPNPDPPPANTDQGDQTVLLASAQLDTTTPIANIEHDKLPEAAQEQVLEILNNVAPTGTHIAYDLPDTVLSTLVLSPIDPIITCGDEILSQTENNFPDAEFVSNGDPSAPKLLVIANPPEGECQLELTGNDTGDYHVITTYADEDEVISTTQSGTTTTGQVTTSNIFVTEDSFVVPAKDIQSLIRQLRRSIFTLGLQKHIHKKASGKLFRSAVKMSAHGWKYQQETQKHDPDHKHVTKTFSKLQKEFTKFNREFDKQIDKGRLDDTAILELTNILDQIKSAGL